MKSKAVIGAAMHKLAHLIYGVLKSGKPYDENHGLVTQKNTVVAAVMA